MISTANVAFSHLPFMDEAPSQDGRAAGAAPALSTDVESSFELVTRARAGDQDAMSALFARYLPRLQRWAHGRLPPAARSAHDTVDLAQDTLLKVFQRLDGFDPRHPGAFKGYVWTTLWNRIRDLGRKYRRVGVTDVLDDDVPANLPSPFEEAIGSETLDRYERALDRLRPEEKEAIVARIEMGLPYTDVAIALGRPSAAAAHMAVSRALVKLAEEMAHERRR